MKRAMVAVCLFALGVGRVASETCTLEEQSVDLTPKLLEELQYDPSGELMSYLHPDRLRVVYGNGVIHDVPINREGGTRSVELIPLVIEVTGNMESPRRRFLEEIRSRLPRAPRGDSLKVVGGHLRIVNQELLRSVATIRYRKRTKVLWGLLGRATVARVRTPVTLDIALKRREGNRTVWIDLEVDKGKTRTRTSEMGVLLDLVLFPITTLSITGLVDRPSEYLEDAISDGVDSGMRRKVRETKKYVDEIFDLYDVDSAMAGSITLFAEIFSERLRHSNLTGFSGTNTKGDAKAVLKLHKVSVDGDASTHVTRRAACMLEAGVERLRKLSAKLGAAEVVEQDETVIDYFPGRLELLCRRDSRYACP